MSGQVGSGLETSSISREGDLARRAEDETGRQLRGTLAKKNTTDIEQKLNNKALGDGVHGEVARVDDLLQWKSRISSCTVEGWKSVANTHMPRPAEDKKKRQDQREKQHSKP